MILIWRRAICLTEGIIKDTDDLVGVEVCQQADYGTVVTVTLVEEVLKQHAWQLAAARRELCLSSSCGLGGKNSIDCIE